MHLEDVFAGVAVVFEAIGAAAMIVGFVIAAVLAVRSLRREEGGTAAFSVLRTTLGSAILLGLEVLVAADLIRTITSKPSMTDALILGMIVLIRTVLSLSIQVEVEGVLPWRRALLTSGGQQLGRAVARDAAAAAKPAERGTDAPTADLIEIVTDPGQAAAVADVAAATFPLACPPHSSPADIAAFIGDNLRPENFARHIADPDTDVLVARDRPGGPMIGYTLIHHTDPKHPNVAAVVTARPVTELSKMYVLPGHHGQRRAPHNNGTVGNGPADDRTAGNRTARNQPAHALMRAAIARATERGSVLVWLGVNEENVRAQRFYSKMGFTRAGVKTFDLNGSIEHDYILVRPTTLA